MKQLIEKIISLLILTYSVYLVYNGISFLLNTFDIADSLSFIVPEIRNAPFDKTNWVTRWILFTGFVTIWGFVGVVASIGLFRNKQWAPKVCLLLFVLNIAHDAIYAMPVVAKCPWEITEWNEFLARLCFNLPLCVYFYFKLKNNNNAEQFSAAGSPGQALLGNRGE